jgi:opacity protein-like surface antigen
VVALFVLDPYARAGRVHVGPGQTEIVMMKRLKAVYSASAVGLMLLAGAAPVQAQITRVDSQQSIGFNLGYFAVRGLDSRTEGDVLFADLSQGQYALAFDVKDFNGATFGGEWLFGIGDFLEAGVGAGFYQRTVPSVYEQKVRDDGAELEQDLKLRIIPMTATVRFLPLGRGGVEPYIGAGVGAFNWRYSEVGEFVGDFDVTFRDRYTASGTTVGPVILGGIRFPVADIWTIGGEIRYQKAEGKGLLDERFLDDKIDLGGWTTSVTFHLRF